jgi:hypothetical protein
VTTTIPTLSWKRANHAALDRFTAQINATEYFVASFDPNQPEEGYRWRLFVRHRSHGPVFLHGHATLQEAQQAAARHIGDE